MPTTPFTDTEIESVRAIIRWKRSSVAELASLLSAFNDAEAAATRTDITNYNKIAYGTVAVLGGFKGTDFNTERDREHIANRIRLRLNLSETPGSLGKNDFGNVSIRISGSAGWLDSNSSDCGEV